MNGVGTGTRWKVSEMAFNWREIYGRIPTRQIMVTKPPTSRLLPYRNDIKSAILEILLTLEIRMIFLKIMIHAGMIMMGPI